MTLLKFWLPLNGEVFESMSDLHSTICDRFNEYLEDWPAHYYYIDLITAAKSRGWLQTRASYPTITVQIPLPESLDKPVE